MSEEIKQTLFICAAVGVIVVIILLVVQMVSALSAVITFFFSNIGVIGLLGFFVACIVGQFYSCSRH